MSYYEGKRVAVLGGAGMIGSQLAELLSEQGAEVTVIDNFSRGRWETVAGGMFQVELVSAKKD